MEIRYAESGDMEMIAEYDTHISKEELENAIARKSASILDTFSCTMQGFLPYGAQLLMAAGLASISPTAIIPHLYYPMAIGLCALAAILFRYPRRYS